METVTLTIDGKTVKTAAGNSVLQAASEAGIFIPTICDHKDLSPYGACRMCIVEIDGVRGYPTSCTTPATEGMQVRTQSDALRELRNHTLSLMFSGHPNSCLVCPHREDCERYRPVSVKAARSTRCGFCSNRDECELRDMALQSGPNELQLPTLYSGYRLERDDPFMDRDPNLCILCGRCWRICEKIHGTPAISIVKRGKWARIGTAFDRSYVQSGCTFCGACIDICPTGTLTDRFARWRGKPERAEDSVCALCARGCKVKAESKGGELLAYQMPEFDGDSMLCAIGRFGAAQILASPQRLIRAQVREGKDQIPADLETAVNAAAKLLLEHKGKAAVLAGAATSREDRHLYAQLAKALQGQLVILPAEAGPDAPQLQKFVQAVEKGEIKAVLANGPFLTPELKARLAGLVLVDCLPSALAPLAEVVLPVAVLDECGGTFRNSAGEVLELRRSAKAPVGLEPEWSILCRLAQALGLSEFSGADVQSLGKLIGDDAAPALSEGDPRRKLQDLVPRFRGHLLADFVPSLRDCGLPVSAGAETPEEAASEGGFLILEKRELVPNMHFFTILAPQVARFSLPGQFVILMAGERSERAPFTLVDWDAEQGTISLVIEEVGRSTRELVALRAGDKVAHVSGPLGLPLTIEKKGTVLLAGGCYGVGAIYPLARALREAGNKVICAIEASSAYLLYMEEKLSEVCDQLLIATKDGSRGTWGGVQEIIDELAEAGHKPDQCILIGCTFMMRMASEKTRALEIPTLVALNPIMVDGTGMCGACRVSVDKATKFACVDGPIFDGHGVDWDELDARRGAYSATEVQALPQGNLNELMGVPASSGKSGKQCCGGCSGHSA